MQKRTSVIVDEFTGVLLPPTGRDYSEPETDWITQAEEMIEEFGKLANLKNIFGKKMFSEVGCPQGYFIGYQYGNNPFYFVVAYHPSHPRMGVIVKFSATSWAEYCKRCPNMNIKKFLDAVSSGKYHFRLSRIDFVADYFNWDMTVNDIYQSIVDEKLEIQNYKAEKNHSDVSGLERNGEASTFYIGSKKTGTRCFERVYDKRAEQLEKKGIYYQEAQNLETWIRFEVVFKVDYAHQLTQIIKNTEEENLTNLIADKIAEKYRFYDVVNKKYTDFTLALIEKSNIDFERLYLESPRDNELISSLLHLIHGSGLFSTLYKCDNIWGEGTSRTLLKHLHEIYVKSYKPNDDVLLWLKNHKSTLKKQSLDKELKILKNDRTYKTNEVISLTSFKQKINNLQKGE